MLYTIAEAAKAMGLEESVILKAIEDRVITVTTKVSGEWHLDDVELNLLYLYLARNYCKHHWQADSQSGRGKHQEPEIPTFVDGNNESSLEQEQSDTRTLADLTEPSPAVSATESTCQDEIRLYNADRICASHAGRASLARRAPFFAATVLLAAGCIAALGSLYFSGQIQLTGQNARSLTPVLDSQTASIVAASVEPRSREEATSTVAAVGSKNSPQERSSPPPITQRGSTISHTAAKKEQPKEKRNPIPVPETRPTTIPGWTVRSVSNGIATLEGPEGTWKVARGDTVPILGKVDSVVLWGNRWIVATSRGLITTP
jgi:hypothetical protein